MKVRALAGFAVADRSYIKGQEAEFPAELADRLIRYGLVEFVAPPVAEVRAAAVPPEVKRRRP